jgi:hypothetical protein
VVPAPTTYARIDMVDLQGTPAVMELELIEPELYLRFFPTAIETFARQLVFILDGLHLHSTSTVRSSTTVMPE